MSTIPEIVPFSETISQTAQEGLGVGGQVIAKSEMPEIGHSGETSEPGQEGLRVGQDVRMSTMPEVGQSDVETSQPVVSGSTSEMSVGAAFDCDLKSEQMGGVHSKGQSSDAATQNPNGLDEMLTAGTKLHSVSEKKSVEVELFGASEDSEWFDAIEKKNCKLLLQLFRSDRSLWVQTGLKGRSVLHVAVMQGCLELVRELHYYEGDLVPCGKNWQTPFEFVWENARDGRLKDASAEDIWLVMEGPRRDFCWELYVPRSRDDYIRSHVMCRMPVDSEDSEMLSLREAISSIAIKQNFVMDENDVDFNFENVERKELYVHMACSRLRSIQYEVDWESCWDQIVGFIIAVLKDLREKNLLQKLCDQKDAQGRTILQVFVPHLNSWGHEDECRRTFKSMLEILPEACVTSLDTAGRTVLHWAVAHDCYWAVEVLLGSGKARPDITFQTAYITDITAFHLIILYDNYLLLRFYEISLKDGLEKDFCKFRSRSGGPYAVLNSQAPLLWAMLMGRNEFVKYVMELKACKELYPPKENELLSLAASSGNVEILQLLLQKDDVDKLNVVCHSCRAPPLHLAVKEKLLNRRAGPRAFDDWLHCNDFISIEVLEKRLRTQDPKKDSALTNIDKTKYGVQNIKINQYNARKACANLLLQAGADILITDKDKCMADPGPWAPNEARIWWYELVAKETLNIKNDLNAAGTGTAVV
ncbi:unnamed protein product, partial [Sphagnum compactum]